MIQPGEDLLKFLNEKDREKLGQEVSAYIDDLDHQNSRYFKDIATWWKWYNAEPLIRGQKNFPFLGASNIVVPLIRIAVDSDVNQVYSTIFRSSTDIWTIRTEREDKIAETNNLGRFLNWAAAGNDFNFRLPAYDNILESRVIGSSVMALNWREDVRWAYAPKRGGKGLRAVKVNWGRGAKPEHVPREQMMWDTNFMIADAPFVVRELHYNWSELRALTALDDSWNREVIENIKGKGELRGPSVIVKKERDKIDGKDDTQFFGVSDVHDIRECHMEWPLLGALGFDDERIPRPGHEGIDQPSPPVVVTIDRNTRKIIRLIAEPYFFPGKPFYDIYYRKQSGRGQSSGIAKMGEQMQRAMTAVLNQEIDAGTRANAVWAKTSMRDMLNKPLNPAAPIYDPTMKGIEPFALPSSGLDGSRTMVTINTFFERLTGQADPIQGRETRSGGHPSPARSTIALIQQGQLLQGTAKELLRMQYSKMGEGILSLYQQFETNEDGKLQRMLGQSDAAQVESFMFPEEPVSAVLDFDVLTLSNDNNPEDEMQKHLLIAQMNQNYWLMMTKAASFLENPQLGKLTKTVVLAAIKAGTKVHQEFLRSGDVDDIEAYTLALGDSLNQGAEDANRAAVGPGQAQGGGAGTPQLGVGGFGGAAAGRAPGESRIGGRI